MLESGGVGGTIQVAVAVLIPGPDDATTTSFQEAGRWPRVLASVWPLWSFHGPAPSHRWGGGCAGTGSLNLLGNLAMTVHDEKEEEDLGLAVCEVQWPRSTAPEKLAVKRC